MTDAEIEDLVLRAVRQTNLARKPEEQLPVSSTAALFGPGSALDSLGLVSLLMDVEEALSGHGYDVTLSDARAMSRSASPFRSVPALVAYVREVVGWIEAGRHGRIGAALVRDPDAVDRQSGPAERDLHGGLSAWRGAAVGRRPPDGAAARAARPCVRLVGLVPR